MPIDQSSVYGNIYSENTVVNWLQFAWDMPGLNIPHPGNPSVQANQDDQSSKKIIDPVESNLGLLITAITLGSHLSFHNQGE